MFGQGTLDDISDFDLEECLELTFLISLNRGGIKLSSEDLDLFLEEEDAHFLELSLSREKPLAYRLFRKYLRGSWDLVLSEEPFLPEHRFALDRIDLFARGNGLLLLDTEVLLEGTDLDGDIVSVYYKYFNQGHDPEGPQWLKELNHKTNNGGRHERKGTMGFKPPVQRLG